MTSITETLGTIARRQMIILPDLQVALEQYGEDQAAISHTESYPWGRYLVGFEVITGGTK